MVGWRHRDDRWLLLLEGLVAIGVGIITLRTPAITAILLTFLMAAWALITGILRIIEAVRLRREIQGEAWLMLGGVASVIFALVIMMRPLAGALALVRVIGAFALILGMSEVMLAFKVRRARQSAAPSSRSLHIGEWRDAVPGAPGANDELLRLHDEEEHQAAQEQPGPNPKRDGFVLEESLQRRRVGEQQLQDHDRADAERQILVAEMRLQGQRRVQQVAAVEQVEDLADR